MTLWIFGDSFSTDHKVETGTNWCNLWGEQHFEDVKNLSVVGSSNDHIMNKIIKTLSDIKSRDSVMVCWSGLYRMCILGHHPIHLTNDLVIKSSDINTKIVKADKQMSDLLYTLAKNYYLNFFTETKGWQELITQIIAVHTMLKDRNIKLVQFLGHSDIASDSNLLADYLRDWEFRCVPEKLEPLFSEYCTRLPECWCLLHSWMKIQSDLMNEQNEFKWTYHRHDIFDDYDDYTSELFKDFSNSGQNMFVDIWHLNSYGHKLFADYVSDTLCKELL